MLRRVLQSSPEGCETLQGAAGPRQEVPALYPGEEKERATAICSSWAKRQREQMMKLKGRCEENPEGFRPLPHTSSYRGNLHLHNFSSENGRHEITPLSVLLFVLLQANG